MRLATELQLDPLRELTALPRPPSWIKGRDKEGAEGTERRRERREGEEGGGEEMYVKV